MKSKVLLLSQADHAGNINFAFVEAPATGVASKNFVSQAQLLELGLIKDIKEKKNVLRVCITGAEGVEVKKDLEYTVRTNLRGTTIEVPGSSYKLNEQRSIARIDSQTARKTAMLKQELEIAQALGLPVGYAELSTIVNNRLDHQTAESRARNSRAGANFGAKPTIERESSIIAD